MFPNYCFLLRSETDPDGVSSTLLHFGPPPAVVHDRPACLPAQTMQGAGRRRHGTSDGNSAHDSRPTQPRSDSGYLDNRLSHRYPWTPLPLHRLRPTDARAGLLLLATLLCWHPHVNATTRHIHTERCRTLGSSSRLFRTAHATVVPRPGFGVFTGRRRSHRSRLRARRRCSADGGGLRSPQANAVSPQMSSR